MKRTVPLLITAIGGFVLIIAFFIPATESWGEWAAIVFDILASIAFVLGGGNLLKVHLKQISDRKAGWGYSAVTIIAFLATLYVGLGKVGSRPAAIQEYYGQSFASLSIADLPESATTTLTMPVPEKVEGRPLPASVRRQLTTESGAPRFRGWITPTQTGDLLTWKGELAWQAAIETLAAAAQPPVSGLSYQPDHEALAFAGVMSAEDRDALLAHSDGPEWTDAVNTLYENSNRETSLSVTAIPDDYEIPDNLAAVVGLNGNVISIRGPMSAGIRDQLIDGTATREFARPLNDEQRQALRSEIEALGAAFNDNQSAAFNNVVNTLWTAGQLQLALNSAGQPRLVSKSATEMLAEKESGATEIVATRIEGVAVELNGPQMQAVNDFATDPSTTSSAFVDQLRTAGEFTDQQVGALNAFLQAVPSKINFHRMLAAALTTDGGQLSDEQLSFLLDDHRQRFAWQQEIGQLFVAAHQTKYPWSGDYAEQGTAFWWAYEYAFKPLTATMFAMLAFYVASAAFRAFRAKNIEAILLLGTAFIILLGRTPAGVALTAWLPDSLSGLRIDELTVYIMSVFNTAGNRAIMIGIALGIASTSLKVLLGMDRSYLGADD